MRMKISLCVLITLCGYNTYAFTIKETNHITNKEWHCTNICKSCYGESYFDKINEKCYCLLRKENSIEDRTCRDEMKINAKIHDIHIVIKENSEPSNRVRREEQEIQETTSKTDIIQSANSVNETVTDLPELVVAEGNPESTVDAPTTTIKPIENANIVAATNTKAKTSSNKNAIERKSRPQKIIGSRKSSGSQDKQIDDLVAEAQQKVEEFVVIHRQNPKEAQNKIKDIQGTFNKVASSLKKTNEPPTLQERINQFEERLASRKSTTVSTLIVEPENLGETNPDENTNNAIVGSRRHPVHKQRYPSSRRIIHNEEHSKPRLSYNENEENIRSRIRLIPRSRLRDRLGAKNPIATTAQTNEVKENAINNEITTLKNTETIDNTKTNELLANTNVENVETNPINNEI